MQLEIFSLKLAVDLIFEVVIGWAFAIRRMPVKSAFCTNANRDSGEVA